MNTRELHAHGVAFSTSDIDLLETASVTHIKTLGTNEILK